MSNIIEKNNELRMRVRNFVKELGSSPKIKENSDDNSDIKKIKYQIKKYFSFIKNDDIVLTNFAKNLLFTANNDIDQVILNLKNMSIKEVETKLDTLTLELNLINGNDILVNKNKKLTEENDLLRQHKNIIEKEINVIENKISTLKNTVNNFYKNDDSEYIFKEAKYILKTPILHLDVDKIVEDLTNKCCEIENINCNELMRHYVAIYDKYARNQYWHAKDIIKINFPINIKLEADEIIIKIYCIHKKNIKLIDYRYVYNIIYITNYGRMIKTNNIEFFLDNPLYSESSRSGCGYMTTPNKETVSNEFSIIKDNQYYICKLLSLTDPDSGYQPKYDLGISFTKKSINIVEQPKLLYRIPQIFINVIDALNTQDTELLQECCKKYFELKKSKHSEIEEKNIIIKSQQEEINKLKIELSEIKNELLSVIDA
jgi:hypothetical protein